MSYVSIYGGATTGSAGCVTLCDPGDITPEKLTSIINEANIIVKTLILDHNKDKAIELLDNIRRQISELTKTPFKELEKSITLTT